VKVRARYCAGSCVGMRRQVLMSFVWAPARPAVLLDEPFEREQSAAFQRSSASQPLIVQIQIGLFDPAIGGIAGLRYVVQECPPIILRQKPSVWPGAWSLISPVGCAVPRGSSGTCISRWMVCALGVRCPRSRSACCGERIFHGRVAAWAFRQRSFSLGHTATNLLRVGNPFDEKRRSGGCRDRPLVHRRFQSCAN
jgi:hypothetical protein